LSVAWFNGKFADAMIALDARDRGFLLGDGVFETIAVRGHRPIWLSEHLARMETAAMELGITFDAEFIEAGVGAVLERSQAGFEALRVTLSRGATQRGLAGECIAPSLLITLDAVNESGSPASVSLKVSKVRRNEHAPSSRLKTLSYIDAIAAAREVAGEADDALMLNTAGRVASTTIANIFLLRGNELITPGLDQGILPGIARRKLLGGARKFSMTPVERAVMLEEIFAADAVFICNSLRLARPVVKLDGRVLGTRLIEDMIKGLEHEA
jgi:branched-chain amino acid aminotransferase